MCPNGFEILPTPLCPHAATLPPDITASNSQHPNCDQLDDDTPNDGSVDNDKMSATSDDLTARSTTNTYHNDDMDDKESNDNDVVYALSAFSIYCLCLKQNAFLFVN
ncbi:hypothetical protein MHU86_1271 [Fragilaria crotonensis]|nr:hypothetical protein MHU86_1271 [Fragilaria crotonensis]